jgi:hypothetical protein
MRSNGGFPFLMWVTFPGTHLTFLPPASFRLSLLASASVAVFSLPIYINNTSHSCLDPRTKVSSLPPLSHFSLSPSFVFLRRTPMTASDDVPANGKKPLDGLSWGGHIPPLTVPRGERLGPAASRGASLRRSASEAHRIATRIPPQCRHRGRDLSSDAARRGELAVCRRCGLWRDVSSAVFPSLTRRFPNCSD